MIEQNIHPFLLSQLKHGINISAIFSFITHPEYSSISNITVQAKNSQNIESEAQINIYKIQSDQRFDLSWV